MRFAGSHGLKTRTACRLITAAPSLFYFPFFLFLLCASFSPAEGGCFERRCSGLESAQNPVLTLLLLGKGRIAGVLLFILFPGAVDVLYALDVLCEMQGLAWVGLLLSFCEAIGIFPHSAWENEPANNTRLLAVSRHVGPLFHARDICASSSKLY